MATGGSTKETPHSICPVCLNSYDGELHVPKLLPCHHTFCLSCLLYMGQQFACPTCRRPVQIPTLGPKALQTNFYITDIHESDLRQSSTTGHVQIKEVEREVGCLKHHSQPLCFFCRWCTEAICRDCTVLDHCQNEGHDVVNIHEVFQEEKQALLTSMTEVNKAIITRKSVVERLQKEMTNMAATKEETLSCIDSCFDEFQNIIQRRRVFLRDAAINVYQQKADKIHETTDEISTNIKCLESANELCSDLVMSANLSELLILKESLMLEVADLLQKDYVHLSIGAYLQFQHQTGIRTFKMATDNLGKVEFGKMLPASIHIIDAVIVAGLKTCVTFQLLDTKKKPLTSYPISASITDSHGDVIKSKVKDMGSVYNLTFTPQVSGVHSVQFYFMGMEFKSHELTVQANNPVFKFGEKGSEPGQFSYPFSVAVDYDGNIYVGDSGNCRVQKFTSTGQYLEEIKISPAVTTDDDQEADKFPLSVFDIVINQKNQLLLSLGDSICDEESEEDLYDSDDALSISSSDSEDNESVETTTDQGASQAADDNQATAFSVSTSQLTRSPSTNTTDRYSSLGRRRNRFRSNSCDSAQYDLDIKRGPKDTKLIEETVYFAINSKNHYVTSAFQEETVNVYNRYGQFLSNIANARSVSTPQKVCTGQNDEIIVADAGNHRIKIYNESGKLVKEFGHKGNGKGKFHEIHGIATDASGRLVVGDEANKRLQIFTKNGELIGIIESNSDPIKCPTGLCLTEDGHVLVVDTTGHRILKYKYS